MKHEQCYNAGKRLMVKAERASFLDKNLAAQASWQAAKEFEAAYKLSLQDRCADEPDQQ